jgi:hypothetical protein
MSDVVENIEVLRDFLTPHKWTRAGLARDCFKDVCDPTSGDAVQFCMSGAIIVLFPNKVERREVSDLLTIYANKFITVNYLYEFDLVHTYEEVIALLDYSIKMERQFQEEGEFFR